MVVWLFKLQKLGSLFGWLWCKCYKKECQDRSNNNLLIMVYFFVCIGIVIIMMIADSIIDHLSTTLLRKYGRISSHSNISSFFTILEMKKLKDDSRLSEEDGKHAKIYYGFMTWGWLLVIVMIILNAIILPNI